MAAMPARPGRPDVLRSMNDNAALNLLISSGPLTRAQIGRATGLSGDWIGIVCGIAGWTSPKILFALTKIAGKLLGVGEKELEKEDRGEG